MNRMEGPCVVEVDPNDSEMPAEIRKLCEYIVTANAELQRAVLKLFQNAEHRPIMGNAIMSSATVMLTESVARWVAMCEYDDAAGAELLEAVIDTIRTMFPRVLEQQRQYVIEAVAKGAKNETRQ